MRRSPHSSTPPVGERPSVASSTASMWAISAGGMDWLSTPIRTGSQVLGESVLLCLRQKNVEQGGYYETGLFNPKKQPVVEVRRVVTTILVDDESGRERAE